MESQIDFHTARALLEWQVELGATEAIGDGPVNCYELPREAARPAAGGAAGPAQAGQAQGGTQTPSPSIAAGPDPAETAREAADAAGTLEDLKAALDRFDLCDLKRGARQTVFADGNPAGRVMIIGEAPGREEDRAGKPFVGRAGQLLDRMLEAVGLGRALPEAERAVYITNILPWRPPQNREPTAEEIGMLMPFLRRHVELAAPEVLVLMGNTACHGVLGRRGITRLRGQWAEALGRPALPMFHPAYLLRNPHAKREVWADLLALQAKLRESS
ncbi:DNA polymerase [Salinihabitans flavidus]|uniref:Type-4 uracil-DNA glycosylase n=1 Tax=Salinihabitans flavidus TaxID=569882 RepID=A0A1H8S769_9RHOB|nr:uracil-DNA glycosylase [Salinihabitans flavidus]SEO74859.1 DNA polymerase [Salinihabitans flavidus]